jgi:hypothetical protein
VRRGCSRGIQRPSDYCLPYLREWALPQFRAPLPVSPTPSIGHPGPARRLGGGGGYHVATMAQPSMEELAIGGRTPCLHPIREKVSGRLLFAQSPRNCGRSQRT